MDNNVAWIVSDDPAFTTQNHDLFTKGIDYLSSEDTHWSKIEVYDQTSEGATRLAERIAEVLNREDGENR